MKFTVQELIEMSTEEFDEVTKGLNLQAFGGDFVNARLIGVAGYDLEKAMKGYIQRQERKKAKRCGKLRSQVDRAKAPQRQNRKHSP